MIQEARKVSKTLLLALKHMHDHNIVHRYRMRVWGSICRLTDCLYDRDLKPENILLRTPANIDDLVLVDFGFAAEVCGCASLVSVRYDVDVQICEWEKQ